MRRGASFVTAVVLLMSATDLSAVGQEAPPKAADKWRPKAGAYAEPGKNFQSNCDEGNDMTIDLGEKSVSGSEWGCKVKSIVDLAPGPLKVGMICSDYNPAQNLNRAIPTGRKDSSTR